MTLTPGRYTTAQFESEIAARLNGIIGITNTYTAVVSTTTQQLTITRSAGVASFAFLFKTGVYRDLYDATVGCLLEILSPATLLGFGYDDYSDTAGVITSPNRLDLQALTNRLYLHVNADNSQELNRIEFGGGRHDCFHIFYLDQTTGGYTFLNKETDTPIYTSSPAPIARMATLDISIRDEFFRLMDLNNRDFCLLFEISYLDT